MSRAVDKDDLNFVVFMGAVGMLVLVILCSRQFAKIESRLKTLEESRGSAAVFPEVSRMEPVPE